MHLNPVDVDDLSQFPAETRNVVTYALEVMEEAMPSTFKRILKDVRIAFPNSAEWRDVAIGKHYHFSAHYAPSVKMIRFNPSFMRNQIRKHPFNFWGFVRLLSHEMVHAYRWIRIGQDKELFQLWNIIQVKNSRVYNNDPEEILAYAIARKVADYIRIRVLPRRDDAAWINMM
jgi:hypothetical protein